MSAMKSTVSRWTGLHWMVIVHLTVLSPLLAFSQLRISPDGHYLTEQDGTPVFLNGESVWCLMTATTYTQADSFFQNCQQYGINFLEVLLIDKGFQVNSPANRNGHTPFTGQTFTTPREEYFTHADSIIILAKTYGIYLHLYISYLGGNDQEAWRVEIGNATIAQMKTWGSYVGARYKNFTNIMWGISGDCVPTPWQQKLDSMSIALLAQDTNHLITPRDWYPSRTQTHWSGRPWLKLEYIYPYWGPEAYHPEIIVDIARTCYNEGRPVFLEEAWYENEHANNPVPPPTVIRQQMYYAVLSGALCGQVFGNGPLWGFDMASRPWFGPGHYRSWLDSPGHVSVGIFGEIIRARNWWKFVPDMTFSVTDSGYGTYGTGSFCPTSYTSDSSSIMVYLPSQHQIRVRLSYLKGDSVTAKWINPGTGAVTNLGRKARVTTTFSPPSQGDWVFLAESYLVPIPPAPALAKPANGATGVSINPTFVWNPSEGAASYRFQASIDPAFASTVVDRGNITTTSTAVSGLATLTTHYWRVNATNSAGTSAYSTAWNFTTLVSVPTQVELLSPPDHATLRSDTAVFVWRRAAPEVIGYWFELATDSNFASRVVDSTLTDTVKIVIGLFVNVQYWWKARARNSAGWGTYSVTRTFLVSITGKGEQPWPPTQFQLKQNYPNPFNPATTIAFDLPSETGVSLIIYNMLGEEVRTLLKNHMSAGAYSLQWNGENDSGIALPSGVYISRIIASNRVVNIKMLLIR
ncbi:MAG: hypothetical protein HW412_1288 [Bacteroidetes bacterium]|nr:hypothetical protein [Bacteroidota bacterium]